MNEVAALRERVDYLETENLMLKAEIRQAVRNGLIDHAKRILACQTKQAQIAVLFAQHREIDRRQIRQEMYPEQGYQPKKNSVDVHLSRLRRAFDVLDIKIITKRAVGWELSESDHAVLREALGMEAVD